MPKREIIAKCDTENDHILHQGDILTNVEYNERFTVRNDTIEISTITFPKVIILTQECDLVQDDINRKKCHTDIKDGNIPKTNQFLLSILVAPIYNLEDFCRGEHLTNIKIIDDSLLTEYSLQYESFSGKGKEKIISNERLRYHHLKIKIGENFAEYVIDFKHYFTVNPTLLIEHKREGNFLASVSPPFRESISQRFTSFLGRVGLPETEIEAPNQET